MINDDLARSPLFQHLDITEVDRLGRQCREAVFEPGEILIALGDIQDAFQIIVQGEVRVTRPVDGTEREVARLGAGSFVGEMSMLTDKPASATITALVRTRAIDVPRAVVLELAKERSVGELLDHMVRRRLATNRLDLVAPIQVEARDGTTMILRPLWPDDWRLMDEARDRISDDTLRQRFFTLPKVHEAFLRRLTSVDLVDQFAWAVLDEGGERLAAVGRYARLPDTPDTAEIALLVADELQRQGLGSLLLVALAVSARAHDVETFAATALAENHAVRGLLESYGATWDRGARGQEVEASWPVAAVLAKASDHHPLAALTAASEQILAD